MRTQGTVLRLAALVLLMGVLIPSVVQGQEPTGDATAQPTPAAPAEPRAGAMTFCDTTDLALSRSLAVQSEEIAWRAAGLAPGSRVSARIIDNLAPPGAPVTQLGSVIVGNRCDATGTFGAWTGSGSGSYTFMISGTTARDAPVELATVFWVVPSALPPTPTPTPRPLPAAPGGLQARALGPNIVRLDWADNSNNEEGFRIDSGAGQFRTRANVTTLNVGVEPSWFYCFFLYAFNDAGESYGGVSCVSTPVRP